VYRERVSDRARFGKFEFDAAAGELRRDGTPVRLQPQPARVLAILVARPGEVVSREDLRQQIWPDGTFVDFERGLNFCIAQIRSALGDSAESPRFIETLPRRGYRFIAPVRNGTPGERAAPEVVVPAAAAAIGETSRGYSSMAGRLWVPMVGLVILALVTGGLVASARHASGDHRIRLAVVPFDNETGMEDFDRIARSVADATVARLATPERLTRISVIGNAAELYQPRAFRDLKRIGGELHAEYIVLAQMKRDSNGVRLIAHLIRVTDQAHVWANTFDRPAFTLDAQSEIAEQIANAVITTLAKPPSHRG
jgi:DNA-binding winged helix-turn-helix (wHTH) protein/TolB-like protein